MKAPLQTSSPDCKHKLQTTNDQSTSPKGETMERIVLFNDFANINSAFQFQGTRPDYADLLDYLGEGRFLIEAHAYVPIDPRNPHGRDRQIENLWQSGWLVHTKLGAIAGDSYKCDFDVEITLDLMRTAEIVKPDIIVLMSGDKDFVPVILELRKRGIRVEVAAFPDGNAAREVILKASGFIDLGEYLREGRSQEEPNGEVENCTAAELANSVGPSASEDESSPLEFQSLGRPICGESGYPRPPAARR
jgi:uncharacterized LabA/DUF88 family protein